MSTVTYRCVLALIMVALGLSGCAGAAGGPDPATARSTANRPSPSASTFTPLPVAEFCGGADVAGLKPGLVRTTAGDVQHYAIGGSGRTTVVLLHQTNGGGLCGFTDFAQVLIDRGVRVMLVDLCGYGQSRCSPELRADTRAQLTTLVDRARTATGDDVVERLVLVGASMGGSVATHVAAAVDADAVVDLSGPVEFGTADLSVDVATITMPALFAFTPTDADDLATVRTLLPKLPTAQRRLVTADSGHGYELLEADSGVSKAVLGWIAGRY